MSTISPDNIENKSDATTIPEELKCLYTQSVCDLERAIKDDGERHSLCVYHRDKANAAQRRSAKKKRDEIRRKRVLKLAKRKAAKLGVPAESLLTTGLVESDLMIDQSNRDSLTESKNDENFQVENFPLNLDDLNWLIEALRASTRD